MSWTKHLFHPRRSAREAEETQRYADEMTSYAEALETQLAEARASAEKLQAEQKSILASQKNVEDMAEQLMLQLGEARAERNKYAADLTEANKQVEQINEIIALVDRFEELRNNYEQRIARLKEKLADARLAIRQLSITKGIPLSDDDLVPIEFNTQTIPQPIDYSKIKPQSQPEKKAEHPTLPPVNREPNREVAQRSLFDETETKPTSSSSNSGEEDDWLRPLPDDIL